MEAPALTDRMALLFAARGTEVVVNGIDREVRERTKHEIGGAAVFVAGDISHDPDTEKLCKAVRDAHGAST